MTLQEEILGLVENYGGLNRFIESCQHLKGKLEDQEEKDLMDDVVTYYRIIHTSKIDMEKDILQFPEHMQSLYGMIERLAEQGDEFAKFYMSIIEVLKQKCESVKVFESWIG